MNNQSFQQPVRRSLVIYMGTMESAPRVKVKPHKPVATSNDGCAHSRLSTLLDEANLMQPLTLVGSVQFFR